MEKERIILDEPTNTIGSNIRWIRKSLMIGQTEMVARLQVRHVNITRETLVKIEGGRQHIKLSQLRGLRDEMGVLYEDILDQPGEKLQKRIEQIKKERSLRNKRRKRKADIEEPCRQKTTAAGFSRAVVLEPVTNNNYILEHEKMI